MVTSNIVITEYKNKICSLYIRDNQLEDLHVESTDSLLSDIYLAKNAIILSIIALTKLKILSKNVGSLTLTGSDSSVLTTPVSLS